MTIVSMNSEDYDYKWFWLRVFLSTKLALALGAAEMGNYFD